MTDEADLATRVAALEATVAELRHAIDDLRAASTAKPSPSPPVLRSRGMLERPKTGR